MLGMTGAASSSSESNNSGEGKRDAGGRSDMGSRSSEIEGQNGLVADRK